VYKTYVQVYIIERDLCTALARPASCDLFADSESCAPGRLQCTTVRPKLIIYALPLGRAGRKTHGHKNIHRKSILQFLGKMEPTDWTESVTPARLPQIVQASPPLSPTGAGKVSSPLPTRGPTHSSLSLIGLGTGVG
jgi:hypothetical protein